MRKTIRASVKAGEDQNRNSDPKWTLTPAAPQPDDTYLDGRDAHYTAFWLTGGRHPEEGLEWLKRLPPVADDFVRVPLPTFASGDPKAPGAGSAIREYENEAKVVDTRLFRKIRLELKGVSLEDFCSALEKETGVRIRASRGVADEKVTVLVDALPARDAMRGVARLFGYYWSRTGDAGAYHYELFQDLRSQLAEEEMRNRDLDGALLALDAAMQPYVQALDLPIDKLKSRAENATGAEKERCQALLHGGWGMAQVYRHLTPGDLAALRRGEMLTFSGNQPDAARRLPAEWRPMLLETGRSKELDPKSGQFVDVADLPDAQTIVDLRLKRSELGQLTLKGSGGVFSFSTGLGGGIPRTLAIGQSPAVANPDNARLNRDLKGQAPFTNEVTLHPNPQCRNLKRWFPFGATFGSGVPNEGAMGAPKPHVDSAEVWEEVHHRTGLPVIADYYSRQHDLQAVTIDRAPLFDALCRTGDRLGVRWRKDGDLLLCRSASYFWDKLKEVPNRLLDRWQADVRADGGLPLKDLLEISELPDQVLNSTITAPVIRQCRDLDEWSIAGGGEDRPLRPYARFLRLLSSDQLREALGAGLPLSKLMEGQSRDWLRLQPNTPADARLEVDYVPAGRHVWMPVAPREIALRLEDERVLSGATPEEALTKARRIYPEATRAEIRRSNGVLALRVRSQGKEVLRIGKPPVLSRD